MTSSQDAQRELAQLRELSAQLSDLRVVAIQSSLRIEHLEGWGAQVGDSHQNEK